MTLVLVGVLLLAYAAAVVASAPRALATAEWTLDRPRTAVALWFSSLLGGVLALAVGVTVIAIGAQAASTLHAGHAVEQAPVHAIHLMVAAVATLAILLAFRARPTSQAQRLAQALRESESVSSGLWFAGAPGAVDVIEHDHLLACALPGRVVISRGLAESLSPSELRAVVEHEFAHLRGRHSTLLTVSGYLERALPWLPATGSMARAMRVLVELAADDRAVTAVGHEPLRAALARVSEAQPSALLALRMARLDTVPVRRPRLGALLLGGAVVLPLVPVALAVFCATLG